MATSIELQPGGSLLVAENDTGRIVRVDPTSGREKVVARSLYKPYAVATAADGTVYWTSGGGSLERLRGGRHATLLKLTEQLGPMTLGTGGAIYFATETRAFRFENGRRRLIARGLHSRGRPEARRPLHGLGQAAERRRPGVHRPI